MVPFAFAAETNVGEIVSGGKLYISDVDVKVGSKSDKNLEDGDKISEEAKPGDIVEFNIEVYNNYTNSEDIEIEDVQITVTIQDIDDGDEIDEEAKEFDIDADDTEDVKIRIQIPWEVDEDTFDVLIEVEGDTDNNGSHEAKMDLEIEVEKEDNAVRIHRNDLTPSEVTCSRTTQLSTTVMNIGNDEQEDASLEVSNAALGVNFRETFDLSDDPFDDDSKFRKTFTFTVEDSVSPGVYPITSKVTFDDGSDTETETADLLVRSCEALKTVEEEEDDSEVVVVQPPVTTAPTEAVAQPVTTPTLTQEETKSSGNGLLVALIVGEILLVLAAIVIVVMVVRKRS
ncbi:hypothetical protein ISS07_00950 [Candidatus Woesearchaeota archaeon]|nr:hypothetical protein [Candidatus Woesearchaeota archaeon]